MTSSYLIGLALVVRLNDFLSQALSLVLFPQIYTITRARCECTQSRSKIARRMQRLDSYKFSKFEILRSTSLLRPSLIAPKSQNGDSGEWLRGGTYERLARSSWRRSREVWRRPRTYSWTHMAQCLVAGPVQRNLQPLNLPSAQTSIIILSFFDFNVPISLFVSLSLLVRHSCVCEQSGGNITSSSSSNLPKI